MRQVQSIEIDDCSREEVLPGFCPDFPYIASCACLDRNRYAGASWHWHRTVELFFVESGCLEYTTPHGNWVFPAGSGGLANANVLHTSRVTAGKGQTVQLLHLFDPVFLSGGHGSRIDTKYILPLTAAPELEMIPLYPEDAVQKEILEEIRQAFALDREQWGYEFRLRHALTEIWLKIFELARPAMTAERKSGGSDSCMKKLMVYVHEHYQEPIDVDALAASAHISRRMCFRVFRENLHMTPVGYIREYRLQKACRMLAQSDLPITQIAYHCGLGSSSYFGKNFRKRFGCTPVQYRRKWHDCDTL